MIASYRFSKIRDDHIAHKKMESEDSRSLIFMSNQTILS